MKKFGIVIFCALFAFIAVAFASGPDLNNDGTVNVSDLGIMLSNWGKTTKPPADINQDGIVNVSDLGVLLSNWGKTITGTPPPPPPSSGDPTPGPTATKYY